MTTNYDTAESRTYATWNPSDKDTNVTLSGWNLTAENIAYGDWTSTRATIGKSSGKWYWENTVVALNTMSAVANSTAPLTAQFWGPDANGWSYFKIWIKLNGSGGIPYWVAYSDGDVIWNALDMDTGEITMYVNGVSQGVMFTWLTGTIYAGVSLYTWASLTTNFWATEFAYSVPVWYNEGLYTVA